MDTASSSILALYLLIFGSVQLIMYRQCRIEIGFLTTPSSQLFVLQKFFLLFIPFICLLRITLQALVFDVKNIYGFMVFLKKLLSNKVYKLIWIVKTTSFFFFQILSTISTVLVYLYSLYILSVERFKISARISPKRHSIALLGFWTLAFAVENFVFINVRSKEYWFSLKT